jgi:hypothetical protein
MKLSNVTFVESWIKEDMVNDKSVLHGFDEPVGTWFASMKVDNEKVWNDFVKTGKVTGFSIDGFFDLEEMKLSKNQTVEGLDIWFENTMLQRGDLVTDLSGANLPNGKHELMTNVIIEVENGIVKDMQQINLNKKEMNVNEIVNAIKQGFASLSLKKEEEVKLGSIANQDGSVTFNFEGDTIAVGTLMSMTGADGEMPVPDGEYTLADGMMVTVAGSTVAEIGSPEAEVAEENAPAPMAAAPQGSPVVKSEKSTQEVFYQLSKEDLNAMTLEFASQLESKISELRAEFKTELESQKPVSLTKNRPVIEKPFEQMTALEKFRASKN